MKYFIVFAAAVAFVSADVSHVVQSDESLAPIVKSDYELSPEGSFQYLYETGNGIAAQADGVVKNPNSEAASLEVKGSFRYTAPDGSPVEQSYIANEDGFQPSGSHIPVPPPVPELILRGLAYIAAHPPPPAEFVKKNAA